MMKFIAIGLAMVCNGLYGQSLLWGNLEKGKYEVGFRTLYSYDYSRFALQEQLLNGQIVSTPLAPARQMHISVWYPSMSKGAKMKYQDYVFEMAKELDFTEPNQQRRDKVVDKVVTLFQEYQQNQTFTKESLKILLDQSMVAVRNPLAATGKFPVLIYPHWFSPMDGSIMGEYLASHGFVVASINMKGTDSTLPEISPRGLKSQTTDINFTVNKLSELNFCDVSKVSVMGVGFNGTAALAALKDNSAIDAFISLDGGIITDSEFQMFQESGDVQITQLNRPMMFINAPHPNIKPELSNYFKYSDKYMVRFPAMSEYYFLNNGMIESILPGIIGKPPGDVKTGYEWASRYVLNFLKFALAGDTSAKQFLLNSASDNGINSGILEPSFLPALTKGLSYHDLKTLCVTGGATGLRKWYEENKIVDAQPLTTLNMTDLFNWLGFRRDEDGSIREELSKIWIESYPNSARGNYVRARILSIAKKKEEAKTYYQRALDLLPNDFDPYLTSVARNRIQTVAIEALKTQL